MKETNVQLQKEKHSWKLKGGDQSECRTAGVRVVGGHCCVSHKQVSMHSGVDIC